MTDTRNGKAAPFSPLQVGCGFLMLTNMLFYLIVLAVSLNLLDPSKLDPDYLAKQRFTATKDPSSLEENAFRKLAETKKKEQQRFFERIESGKPRYDEDTTSPAIELSKKNSQLLASSQRTEDNRPKAAFPITTQTRLPTKYIWNNMVKSRWFDTDLFPSSKLKRFYLPKAETAVLPERYDAITIELATGVDVPYRTILLPNRTNRVIYSSPNPIPEATFGGPKLRVPKQNVSMTATNEPVNVESGSWTGRAEVRKDPL